jgi:ATP-dependent RNA helicase DHX37/DHR1
VFDLSCFLQDKKLKKEERVLILEKLSYVHILSVSLLLKLSSRQTQAELPTTLHLQSSATLGTGKPFTHQERFDQLEDKEVRRALDGRRGKRKRHDSTFNVDGPDDEDDELNLDVIDAILDASDPPTATTTVGGALRRNADDVVPPVQKKAKNNHVRYRHLLRQSYLLIQHV